MGGRSSPVTRRSRQTARSQSGRQFRSSTTSAQRKKTLRRFERGDGRRSSLFLRDRNCLVLGALPRESIDACGNVVFWIISRAVRRDEVGVMMVAQLVRLPSFNM